MHWRAVVKAAMKHLVPQNAKTYQERLSYMETNGGSKTT
jgi:hypothetical protein